MLSVDIGFQVANYFVCHYSSAGNVRGQFPYVNSHFSVVWALTRCMVSAVKMSRSEKGNEELHIYTFERISVQLMQLIFRDLVYCTL
jgi:hypothetical protein